MIYSVVLFSGIQQSELDIFIYVDICIYVYTHIHVSFADTFPL